MIDPHELEKLEDSVEVALRSGSDEGLRILGFGEITLVVGWPPDIPRLACKRLPLFGDEAAVHRYADLLDRYVKRLTTAGIGVVDTSFHYASRQNGSFAGYVVQPIVPAESLVPRLLAADRPNANDPVVNAIVAHVVDTVGERCGLDAQVSNWALVEGRVCYFDVTTPMLRGIDGRPELDLALFLAAFPWALRGALRKFVAPGVLARYHDPRSVLLDLAANLWKERLSAWIPAVTEAVNRRVQPPLTEDEIRKDYAKDAHQWELLLRLRRADRWWQRSVRRRTYPFLLPGHIER